MQLDPTRTTDTDDLDPRRYPRYRRVHGVRVGSATTLRTVSVREFVELLLVRLGIVR